MTVVEELFVVCRRNDKIFITGNSINAKKLGITRNDAKSITYGLLYGASAAKVATMLKIPFKQGEKITNDFWNAVEPLKMSYGHHILTLLVKLPILMPIVIGKTSGTLALRAIEQLAILWTLLSVPLVWLLLLLVQS